MYQHTNTPTHHLLDDEIDDSYGPGADGRRQQVGAERDGADGHDDLPELGQQGVESVSWRMSNAEDGGDELVLGRVAEEHARGSGGGVEGEDDYEDAERER